ncbi:MAG: hypothetical protein AAF587_07390 [Bacteroidota bacterium]
MSNIPQTYSLTDASLPEDRHSPQPPTLAVICQPSSSFVPLA